MSTAPHPVVLLSVRSPHVERLLSGEKTIEFRRRRWNVPDGTVALLYRSRQQRAIVGSLTIAATHVGSRSAMWEEHGSASGITRQAFREYFDGADLAVAIEVSNATELVDPLLLAELRRRSPDFHVPQSYRFMRPAELGVVLNGERALLLRS